MQRRQLLSGATGMAVLLSSAGCTPPVRASRATVENAQALRFREAIAQIEQRSGGRLGVAVRDTQTGREWAYRGDERFPMCSTFKLLLAAAVLRRVDQRGDTLAARIAVTPQDIVPYAPVTQPRVNGEPMSLAELCEATVTLSDNAAANLLLARLGGPQQLTAFARTLGDVQTRLDRNEPTLNEALPGDPRDTTTPVAMLESMARVTLGDGLSPASRAQLVQWLQANKTGDRRLRALLPPGWRVGDKTGSGERGTHNDIGLLWPPTGAPLLVTAYLTGTAADMPTRDRVHAEVGRLAASMR